MNHGHFFKLNQYLSKLADGIAIYDYTELQAYSERGRNNAMSPKYPISVVIKADTVSFKMHYCAYKNKSLIYNYSINSELSKNIQLVHVEDEILELPYVENPSKNLTDIVKGAYIANFPQVSANKDPNFTQEMTGSRFIDKLIKEWTEEQDGKKTTVSYSTLWLMDLFKDNKFNLYNTEKINDKSIVTKFLRKLLLDFMFDLKHSTVFCTSPDYNRMYNGLMSDYYFSALMHKCEFFYYRQLIIEAIEEHRDDNDYNKQITLLYAQELFKAEELWAADIRNPLSDKFFEQKFPDDFEQNNWIKGRQVTELCSNVIERMTTTRWDSWFANPEEEMRRIYFTMKENGVKRICNSFVLTEYLSMDKSEDLSESDTIKAMALSARQNRGKTSRWFLNRYDFNDVLHLHLFKWANPIWVAILFVFLFVLLGIWNIPFIKEGPSIGLSGIFNLFDGIREVVLDKYRIGTYIACVVLIIICIRLIKWGDLRPGNNDPLLRSVIRFRVKRLILIVWIGLCLLLLPYNLLHADYHNWLYAFLIIIPISALVFLFFTNKLSFSLFALTVLICWWCDFFNDWTKGVWTMAILIFLAGLYLLIDATFFSKHLKEFRKPFIHPIESWHLLLPKLVASITAAWLTISMGFDVLVAFFDSHVVWSTMSIIIIVVFSFILYQIDRELPESSSWLKVYRTIEMFIISYCLSFCIGLVIINFIGERYLERSGSLNDYYDEYVYEQGKTPVILSLDGKDTLIVIPALETLQEKRQLLSHDYTKLYWNEDSVSCIDKDHAITNKDIIYSSRDLLIIQDFLIMFSFVAMFIGVFLQMVFFDRKKMTEF